MTEQDAVPGAGKRPAGLERALAVVPRFLSSHLHVIWLMGLGIYLVVLPLCGVHVPAQAELIGGNYTNVTSDIGACIAAGGTVHLVKQQKKSSQVADATHKIMADLYRDTAGRPHPAAVPEITGQG